MRENEMELDFTPERRLSLALGLDPDAPPTTSLDATLLAADVSRDLVLGALRNSARPESRLIVALYDRLQRGEQSVCTLDHLAMAAKMDAATLMGVIASEMYAQAASVATIKAALRTPEVMDATLAAAMNPKFGHADRKMLLQASGNAPTPKNQVTNIRMGDVSMKQTAIKVDVPSLGEVSDFVDSLTAGE